MACLIVAGSIVAGCQASPSAPPALSLEEAKQITTVFEEVSFVPPPKSIKDITDILDSQKMTKVELSRTKIDLADRVPPETNDAGILFTFYQKRANAARHIGRLGQALSDIRQARSLLEETSISSNKKGKFYRLLSIIEWSAGSKKTAIEAIEMSVQERPTWSGYLDLVKLYAKSGKIKALKTARSRSKIFFAKTYGKGGGEVAWNPINSALVDFHYYQALGEFDFAERAIRRCINIFKSEIGEQAVPQYLPSRLKMLAGILRKQGRLLESEIVVRDALLKSLDHFGRNNSITADITRQFGMVVLGQGRIDDAEKLFREALAMFRHAGLAANSGAIASTHKDLINALALREDWAGAFKVYEQAREDLRNEPIVFKKMFINNRINTIVLLKNGYSNEALKRAREGVERTLKKYGATDRRTVWWAAVMALAYAEEGNPAKALAAFQDVVPHLISGSNAADDEVIGTTANNRKLQWILETYIDLLAGVHGSDIEREASIDAISETFRIADAARAQLVQSAVVASGVRAAANSPELADLIRREQNTQKQISALYATQTEVLNLPTDQQAPDALAELRSNISSLERAQASLEQEIHRRFPDYAELSSPQASTIEHARHILHPGEALIVTYVGRNKTHVWAIPKEGPLAFATARLGQEDLADEIGLIRSSLEPQAETLGDIPDFDVEAAYGLYDALFKPVEQGWKKAERLVVVAHGPLGYLPLSVLPTEPIAIPPETGGLFSNYRVIPWLVRTHSITMVPSVTALATLRGLPPAPPDRKAFAGFGDPVFHAAQTAYLSPKPDLQSVVSRGIKTRSLQVKLRAAPNTERLSTATLSDLPQLPDTSDEINGIALALNADLTQDVFLGSKANESVLKSKDFSGYKVLAFATHGLVPGDIDGLTQPALALSDPALSGGTGDGLLTMDEILSLRLNADWVVLSACNTGSGRGAGAEAVSGLGRAFFYAGTRALLVSNWPVETTSAKALTTDLFKRQSENDRLTRDQALRSAMLALIDGPGYIDSASGKSIFSYSHPIFWAPFTLIGDGG